MVICSSPSLSWLVVMSLLSSLSRGFPSSPFLPSLLLPGPLGGFWIFPLPLHHQITNKPPLHQPIISKEVMWATMALTGSKQLLLQNYCAAGRRMSAPLRRLSSPILQQSHPHVVTNIKINRVFFSSYSNLVHNNRTFSEPDNNALNEIKKRSRHSFGKIVHINHEKRYAFLIEDESNDRVYLHFGDIDSMSKGAKLYSRYINPVAFSIGLRVRFEIMVADKEKKAFNVTRSNGDKIPLLRYNDALSVAKGARAWLGHRCYEILSDEEQSAESMAERIHKVYQECNESIKWAKSQLVDSDKIIKECKAELGNDVFDILENVSDSFVDNICFNKLFFSAFCSE